MAGFPFADWAPITGMVLSLLVCAYSLFVLSQTRKEYERLTGQGPLPSTSSMSPTTLHPRDLLLKLLALAEPQVKRLLATRPEQVLLQTSTTEEGKLEAVLIGRRGDAEARVV